MSAISCCVIIDGSTCGVIYGYDLSESSCFIFTGYFHMYKLNPLGAYMAIVYFLIAHTTPV